MHKIPNKFKRVVVISDLHCGHQVGLTPPDWQYRKVKMDVAKQNKYADVQDQCWKFYEKTILSLQPIDILVVNGDAIDGNEPKSGGIELIHTCRDKQSTMAADAIRLAKAKQIVMTYGTGYHTGIAEDWENNVAGLVGAKKIGAHEWIDVNGLIMDFKHKVGSSGVPHARGTSIAKAKLWNNLWALHSMQPLADVLIRSHVHYHFYVGDPHFLAMTTPALQAMGSRFGSRECEGEVHFGLVHFDIVNKENYVWHKHIAKISAQATHALKL